MPDSIQCTFFLFLSLLLSGIGQTFWMRSERSHRFNTSIDRGRTFRNKRLFGKNKTWRGFVFMVPATGLSFVLVHLGMSLGLNDGLKMWPLSEFTYFLLGCWTGFCFMLMELPNSFLKRQFDIHPGKPAQTKIARNLCFVVDQVDSVAGGLLAICIVVPLPFSTACSLIVLGAVGHYVFNLILKQFGFRKRAA